MTTTKTLQVYLERCEDTLSKVKLIMKENQDEADSLLEYVGELRDQTLVITGQIQTLQQLLDTESNPPIVEYPIAGDALQELHDKRLDGPEGLSHDEVKKGRQPVYKHEALQAVEQIDAANQAELSDGESAEVDS